MIEELMTIYNNSKLNDGEPKCIFAETLVFNEGWLLRCILEKRRGLKSQSKYPFLPFPKSVKIYSEAQLYTPFKKRSKNDNQGEYNTRVDGIVGNFSIHPSTKSGIDLDKDFNYLTVFEAKMYSRLSSGIKNVKNYSQVSRTIACIINSIIRARKSGHYIIYFVVLYPNDNYKKIGSTKYTKNFVVREIEERLRRYKQNELVDQSNNNFEPFRIQWKGILKNINILFVTWEDILNEIKDPNLNRYYELCKKYNK